MKNILFNFILYSFLNSISFDFMDWIGFVIFVLLIKDGFLNDRYSVVRGLWSKISLAFCKIAF
jgi:hypothetical protein